MSRLSDGYTYFVCVTVTISVFVSTVLQAGIDTAVNSIKTADALDN